MGQDEGSLPDVPSLCPSVWSGYDAGTDAVMGMDRLFFHHSGWDLE